MWDVGCPLFGCAKNSCFGRDRRDVPSPPPTAVACSLYTLQVASWVGLAWGLAITSAPLNQQEVTVVELTAGEAQCSAFGRSPMPGVSSLPTIALLHAVSSVLALILFTFIGVVGTKGRWHRVVGWVAAFNGLFQVLTGMIIFLSQITRRGFNLNMYAPTLESPCEMGTRIGGWMGGGLVMGQGLVGALTHTMAVLRWKTRGETPPSLVLTFILFTGVTLAVMLAGLVWALVVIFTLPAEGVSAAVMALSGDLMTVVAFAIPHVPCACLRFRCARNSALHVTPALPLHLAAEPLNEGSLCSQVLGGLPPGPVGSVLGEAKGRPVAV